MLQKIKETIDWLRKECDHTPQIGIILGSGLSDFTREIDVHCEIPYEEIPHFPRSTVAGHEGYLVFGKLAGKEVVAMKGRFHYYEGYSMKEITFPVRVMKYLGAKLIVISNACGGVNPAFKVGDIMVIYDHINLMGDNPLLGQNEDEMGPRFPDMGETYDKKVIDLAKKSSAEINMKIHYGVYAAVSGPVYETPAEYRYIHYIGADAVGMSTVPEAIVARHMNLDIFAVSVITDLGIEGHVEKITHDKVVQAARAAEPKLARLIQKVIEKY